MSLREISRETTIADRLLLIVLIIISASGFIFVKKVFPEGTDVMISVDGKPAYKLSLNEDKTLRVGVVNGCFVIVEIKDKWVRVGDADCPNRICISNGWIERGAIVCLPNRIAVTVISPDNGKHKDIDAITG